MTLAETEDELRRVVEAKASIEKELGEKHMASENENEVDSDGRFKHMYEENVLKLNELENLKNQLLNDLEESKKDHEAKEKAMQNEHEAQKKLWDEKWMRLLDAKTELEKRVEQLILENSVSC